MITLYLENVAGIPMSEIQIGYIPGFFDRTNYGLYKTDPKYFTSGGRAGKSYIGFSGNNLASAGTGGTNISSLMTFLKNGVGTGGTKTVKVYLEEAREHALFGLTYWNGGTAAQRLLYITDPIHGGQMVSFEISEKECYLRSGYASDNELDSFIMMLQRYVDMEKDFFNGTIVDYNSKLDGVSTPIQVPFANLFAYIVKTSDTAAQFYTSYAVGDAWRFSAVNMYHYATGFLAIEQQDLIDKGGVDTGLIPAYPYNPNGLTTTSSLTEKWTYDRSYPAGGVSEKIYEASIAIGNYTITRYVEFYTPFMQLPDPVADRVGYTWKNYYDTTTANNWILINESNGIMGGTDGASETFLIALSQKSYVNLFKDASVNAKSNMGSEYRENGIGAVAICSVRQIVGGSAYLPKIQYATAGDGVNIYTGNDILNTLFKGLDPYKPSIDDNIPEDGSTPVQGGSAPGSGGISDASQQGGNGTWEDVQDNTAFDPSKPITEQPIFSMPDGVAGGYDANFSLVKMGASSFASLAAQSWTTNSWLQQLKETQGDSRITDGIADMKVAMLDITATGTKAITKIAGFDIANTITAQTVNQYNVFDLGSLKIPRYFDSFLDFSPYTEFTLELPFAQPVKIPPEMIVGDSLQLILIVDVLNGSALYIIQNSTMLIAQVPANVFYKIPFATSEYNANISELRSAIMGMGANFLSDVGSVATSMTIGSVPGAVTGFLKMANDAASAANYVDSQKYNRAVTLVSGGGAPGEVGTMGIKKAILKCSRPYVTYPKKYFSFEGAPSSAIGTISSCTDYFKVKKFYPSFKAPADELNEIASMLSEGVYP